MTEGPQSGRTPCVGGQVLERPTSSFPSTTLGIELGRQAPTWSSTMRDTAGAVSAIGCATVVSSGTSTGAVARREADDAEVLCQPNAAKTASAWTPVAC